MGTVRFIFLLSILIFIPFSSSFALENGDWQLWNTDGIEYQANSRLKLAAEEELRFGDGMSRLYYHHTQGGFDIKCFDWLSLGADYRQVWEKFGDKWKQENRPQINGTLSWDFKAFKVQDRSRMEYRIRKWKQDDWRYRNKLTVLFPLKFEKVELDPYVADEMFFNCGPDNRLARNRLYGGLKLKLYKHIKGEVYYMWQSSREKSGWTGWNVLGLKASLAF